MKTLLTGVTVLFTTLCVAQSTPKRADIVIADSGKREFKKQAGQQTPDYTKAYRMLTNQLKLNPANAELHYFLGYTIDRINMSDGSRMVDLNKDMTLKSSTQFEEVNRLQPIYKGEMLALDPYSKLSSVWGSLAQAYLTRGLKDSAVWAFSEGKKRGGFIDAVLEYNRQMLNSCSSNGILVTYGDNITIPLWYLQTVEKYRTDITVIDANLINTGWYTRYLKNEAHLKMSFTDSQIDTLDYIEWQPQQITINNPADGSQSLSWELRPTYAGRFILKGDRMLLDILRENFFRRDVYFPATSDSSYNLFLEKYLLDEGLVTRLSYVTPAEGQDAAVSPNLDQYNIRKVAGNDMKKSRDAVLLLNGFRWAYYTSIYRLLAANDKRKARTLAVQLQQKFGKTKLPYLNAEQERYFTDLDALTK